MSANVVTDRRVALFVTDLFEQTPPHDLEGLFGGHRLPQRLHMAEGFFQRPQGSHAAVGCLLPPLIGQGGQKNGVGNQLARFGEGLNEGQVTVERAAAQRLAGLKLTR